MLKLEPEDARLSWWNVAEWSVQEHGLRPERVPRDWRSRFTEAAAWRAIQPAGVEVRFRTDSGSLILHWWQGDASIPMLDRGEVYCAGTLIGEFATDDPTHGVTSHFSASREGPADWQILLPWSVALEIESISVDDNAQIYESLGDNTQRCVLCYGDSITQGYCASRPSLAWPRRLAEEIGCRTINLGFGGAAFCEPEVAEYIASRLDWDALVVAAGINTAILGHESADDFRKTYTTFLEVVRSAHPSKPILCITPMLYTDADEDPSWRNACGSRASEYRQVIESVVAARLSNGDDNLYLQDGLSIIGSSELLADCVHPTDDGMRHVAEMIGRKWIDEVRV